MIAVEEGVKVILEPLIGLKQGPNQRCGECGSLLHVMETTCGMADPVYFAGYVCASLERGPSPLKWIRRAARQYQAHQAARARGSESDGES
jgi:hypothetical protein